MMIILFTVLKVLVDKRMIFNTLKKNLEPYVGVPAEYFKICRYFDDCGESECSCLLSQLVSYEDGEKLWIEIGRALRNGEFTVKLHQFFLDSAKVRIRKLLRSFIKILYFLL